MKKTFTLAQILTIITDVILVEKLSETDEFIDFLNQNRKTRKSSFGYYSDAIMNHSDDLREKFKKQFGSFSISDEICERIKSSRKNHYDYMQFLIANYGNSFEIEIDRNGNFA